MYLMLNNPPRRSKARKTAKAAKARKPRRKLSPAARAALIARLNKGRRAAGLAPIAGGSTRRPSARRRRRRSTVALATNPPKKGSNMARRSRRSSSRRTSRRSGAGRSARGFAIPGGLAAVAGSVAGFTAAQILPDYIPVNALKTGYGRIGAQAAAGVLTFALLRKTSPTWAAALGGGMLTAAGVSLVSSFMARRQQAGGTPPAALPPAASPEALRGIGDVDGVRYAGLGRGLGDFEFNTYG
jgi:hypothetical protein